MFRGPYFILSAMHAGTTTIFKVIEAIETHTSSNIPFTMQEFDIALHRNRDTAPGADCITYRMISNALPEIKSIILHMFYESFLIGKPKIMGIFILNRLKY